MRRTLSDLWIVLWLGLLLAVPAFSAGAAGLVPDIPYLLIVLAAALIHNALLARASLNEVVSVLVTSITGFIVVWGAAAYRLLPSATSGWDFAGVGAALNRWLGQVAAGGSGGDPLVTGFLLGLLCWYFAFNAVWALLLRGSFWVAVIPPGAALLLILTLAGGNIPREGLLLAFLFIAFMLAAVERSAAREGQAGAFRTGVVMLVATAILLLAILAGAASLPPLTSHDRGSEPSGEISSQGLRALGGLIERLLGGSEGGGDPARFPYGGDYLAPGDEVDPGSDPVLSVVLPQGVRLALRGRVFTTYRDGRWLSTSDAEAGSVYGILPPESPEPYDLRRSISQTVTFQAGAVPYLYAAGQPLSFASLPVSYAFIRTTGEGASIIATRPSAAFVAGEWYQALSSVSYADAYTLRAANEVYPAWVEACCLQVPPDLQPALVEAAGTIVTTPSTAYDRAAAIEAALRQIDPAGDALAEGKDPALALIEGHGEGAPLERASAMALLLRALGVPTRLVSGFAGGEYLAPQGATLLREDDAHVWVEVFFPGYGWIEFEPSPALPAVDRETLSGAVGDDADLPLADLLPAQQPTPAPEAVPVAARPCWLPATLTLVVAGLLAVGAVWLRLEVIGTLRLSPPERAYRRMAAYMDLVYGRDALASLTPDERADWLVSALPGHESRVRLITAHYTAIRYGNVQAAGDVISEVSAAWRQLRPALIRLAVRQRLFSGAAGDQSR